jgi:hypothetical protein
MTKSKALSTESAVQNQVSVPTPVVARMGGGQMPQRAAAASPALCMDATGTMGERTLHPPGIGAQGQGTVRRAEFSKTLQRSVGNARLGRMAAPVGRPQQRQERSSVPLVLASARASIQPKLTLGAPHDVYEEEANRVATNVMRMPEPGPDTVQRACSECAKDRGHGGRMPEIRRQEASGHAPQIGTDTETEIHRMRGGGQPLPPSVRRFMEPRFGEDFSGVRVHTGAEAGRTAHALNARAYTVGHDVVFAAGQYAPDTAEGKQLLAHELTHVVQQSSAPGASAGHKLEPAGGATAPGAIVQRDSASPFMSPEDLVDTYRPLMMYGQFDQVAQVLFTNFIFRGQDYAYVMSVFEKLPDDWEDNVAALFTEKLDPLLDSIAASSHGRAMLTVLYEAMITGDVSTFEREQSERILSAKARQMKPEDFIKAEKRDWRGNPTQIFPVRFMRVTPGYDDAPLMAKLTSDGKVWVNYPNRVKDSRLFAAEVRTLRGGTFLSEGQTLNPNEIVGIKDYEQETIETIYRPALALIDYSNRVKHSTVGKIVQVSIAAATFGLSAPAAGAKEAGKWAVRLAWADRIANYIQVVSFFVGENRDWLIHNLGWAGRKLVEASEIADSAVAIYGLGRLGHAGFKIASDLRAATKAAREEAAKLTELSGADLKKLENIDAETEKLARELEEAQAAQPRGAKSEIESFGLGNDIDPEQLKGEIDELRKNASDPAKVHRPADPHSHYDAEMTAPDGHDLRRDKETRLWERCSDHCKTGLKVDPEVDRKVDQAIIEEPGFSDRPARRPRPQAPASRGAAEAARERFDRLRDGFAEQLAVEEGGQVHHAIELQVLDRYPGVYTEAELNDIANMRGIPPELEARRQLHNAKIREIYNRHYRALDAQIEARGLSSGTPQYNTLVRQWLTDARNEIDWALRDFFSENLKLVRPAK